MTWVAIEAYIVGSKRADSGLMPAGPSGSRIQGRKSGNLKSFHAICLRCNTLRLEVRKKYLLRGLDRTYFGLFQAPGYYSLPVCDVDSGLLLLAAPRAVTHNPRFVVHP